MEAAVLRLCPCCKSILDDERKVRPKVSRLFHFALIERHLRQPFITWGDFKKVQLLQISERLDGLVCFGGQKPNGSYPAHANRMVEPSCARFLLTGVRQSTR